MRRWDRLLDSYLEEYRARGVSPQSVCYTEARLHRWGRWLKGRRPRVGIERIDAEMITRYMANCSSFRAKATVYATLSSMRGFGDYLVRQGLWKINPLRWMKGPKVTPYSRLPKRIDHAHMEAMWREAANRHGAYTSHLWVTVLAMLYGTGLRRGELERLNIDAFDRTEGTLRIDGRKTGQERCVPLPEMVLRCLEAYLPLRHNQLEEAGFCGECALLVSRNGKRLTGGAISNGIHAISRRAQVPIHSLHQFRHSCASDLLESGVHLAEVQRILGHCGIGTEGYFSYLDKVGRKTPRTIVDVRCTLRRAIVRLEQVRPGVELWHLKLEDYLHWLEAERQCGSTESSLAKYLSHVRGLLEYAWRSGRAVRNVLDGFSLQHTVRRAVPKSLNLDEAERLVQATTAPGPTVRRDRLIILLLYGCGLRTNELCALDVVHLNRERRELVVLKAKNDRPRAIPIPDAVYTELLAYLLEHGKRGPLFRTSTRKRRLWVVDVCEVVTAAATRAGLRAGVTPRTLRHSFATHLMDRGVDLAIIASLMGHRSPQETGVYLHVLPERPQAAVRTLPIGERS